MTPVASTDAPPARSPARPSSVAGSPRSWGCGATRSTTPRACGAGTATSCTWSSARPGRAATSGGCTTPTAPPGCSPAARGGPTPSATRCTTRSPAGSGPGLLTAEGEDWTRQKRFLQPLFTKVAVDGYADLMVDEIEAVVGEWDIERLAHRRPRRCRCSGSPCAWCSRPCSATPPTTSCPTCATRSPPSPTRSCGAGWARCGCRPASRPVGCAAGGPPATTSSACATPSSPARREGRTTGETDLLSLLLAARDGDERLERRGGAQPGAAVHAGRPRDHGHRAHLRPAPARPPPGRAGRRARRGARGGRRPAPHRGHGRRGCR